MPGQQTRIPNPSATKKMIQCRSIIRKYSKFQAKTKVPSNAQLTKVLQSNGFPANSDSLLHEFYGTALTAETEIVAVIGVYGGLRTSRLQSALSLKWNYVFRRNSMTAGFQSHFGGAERSRNATLQQRAGPFDVIGAVSFRENNGSLDSLIRRPPILHWLAISGSCWLAVDHNYWAAFSFCCLPDLLNWRSGKEILGDDHP